MRIAIIGAGAMGSVYGGLLSVHDDVTLIDTNKDLVDHINREGLRIEYKGQMTVYHPKAAVSASGMAPVDLIIVFVKSQYTDAALSAAREIIGKDTYLMSLQNGGGHKEDLRKHADSYHIIIGTTEDNGRVISPGYVIRGGEGRTNIGKSMISDDFIARLSSSLSSAGFKPVVQYGISYLIWEKLAVNASLSALTAVLSSDMSYIAGNAYAWSLCTDLVSEIVMVAKCDDVHLDEERILENVRRTSLDNPGGITSIAADIQAGRKTECDYITGYVVRTAEAHGLVVPRLSAVHRIIKALEGKNRQ